MFLRYRCHAGSHDLMLGLIPDFSGKTLRLTPTDSKLQEKFWNVARLGRDQTKMFIESNGPITAVRIFDFAMSFSDMNNLVHWTAQSRSSQGRAYSAGVTNAGVFEKQKSVMREGVQQRTALKVRNISCSQCYPARFISLLKQSPWCTCTCRHRQLMEDMLLKIFSLLPVMHGVGHCIMFHFLLSMVN